MLRAAALALSVGCWSGSAPEHRASPKPRTAAPIPKPSAPADTRSAGELADQLAAELRDPNNSLQQYIHDAVVLVDLDASVTQALCKPDAIMATAAWRVLLSAGGNKVHCNVGPNRQFGCFQATLPVGLIWLSFVRGPGDRWTLLEVVAGRAPKSKAPTRDQINAARASRSCPP